MSPKAEHLFLWLTPLSLNLSDYYQWKRQSKTRKLVQTWTKLGNGEADIILLSTTNAQGRHVSVTHSKL